MSIYVKSVVQMFLKFNRNGKTFKPGTSRRIHHYKNTIPWKNTVELSKYLVQSAIHHDNGLLVLNKPYGVTFARDGLKKHTETAKVNPEDIVFNKKIDNQTKKIYSAYCTSGVVSEELNLLDCLPYLKNHFGCEELHIARVPEKYVSGIAILTTSKELKEKVIAYRLHPPSGKDKYLTVVAGVPRYSSGKIQMGFKLEDDAKKGKRVILVQKWSNRAYKRGEIRIGTFHYETICTGHQSFSSLVEICVDLRKYHAYRVFASDYLLSPVLGDNLFGGRVQTVMGVPMLIPPFNDAANSPQRLPNEMYRLLNISSGEASLIPVHVHLAEMLLPKFLNKKESLLLKALPPPHFEWTCEQLGLLQPEKTMIASV